MKTQLTALFGVLPYALCQSSSFSPTPVSTAVPSATVALNSSVVGQGLYPPLQEWCSGGKNDTFCPGVLLQDVELAGIFPDSKTFVDKPTLGTLNSTLQAFAALPANVSVGDIEKFVNQYYKGEGLELEQVAIEGFVSEPAILDNISDPVYKGWVSTVNGYWQLLIRQTNQSSLCNGTECSSSLIPLNYTIVVPGGRYREIYYWDSYWILQGLLKSELYTYSWDLLQNFMDLIEAYGFLPNGGRKYYLNRSQPPVFVQMLDAYIKATGNSSILERALPIATEELAWWSTNRTIPVKSPYTNVTHMVAHFAVINSAPRPEGYVEDFSTAMGASPALNSSQRAELYSELASGAESGWDYSSRWCKQPLLNLTDNDPALRTLNVKAIIPVDLNSLLAGDHAILATLYDLYTDQTNHTSNSAKATYHRLVSANFTRAVLDLHWSPSKSFFYDFNLTSNTQSDLYTPAGLWPLWQNITPTALIRNETAALGVVSGARYLLGKYAGIPSVATLLATGLNWDFPNSWPPHVYTSIKAFETLYRINPQAAVISNLTIPYSSITSGQLGLNESSLQPQPSSTIGNTSLQVDEAAGKPWPVALSIEYANRYMQSAFCSWYSTGGSIDGILTQLPLADLNSTGTYTADQTGVMFEKFNATDPDAAGGGGEYTVQTGFGWTNGVVLWLAGTYGSYLPAPTCPLIPIVEGNYTINSNGTMTKTAATLYQGFRIPGR